MEVIIAPKARSDIANILAWSNENFGPRASKRYARLITAALHGVGTDPDLAGSVRRVDIGPECRTYHLYHSRKAARRRGPGVHHPRHFLLYRVTAAGFVEIGRVLHESMDLDRHLPEAYRREIE